MEITKFRPVPFDKKYYYTLPEAIKRICKAFEISLHKIKHENEAGIIEYKTIYQRLRRELESMRLTEPDIKKVPGKRKTQYSRSILYHVVNEKLYLWLCEKAERITHEEFEQWKKAREERWQAYMDHMRELQHKDPDQVKTNRFMEETFRMYKLEIALEYIFDECIVLNEQLLREDIALMILADAFDPSPVEDAAITRLNDYKNYYTDIKKRSKKK